MAIDYGEKERQFLDALQAETGRDLAQWMAAIDAANLTHRNAIIDWLRRQGFMFSKASWLERIHTNGGKPIYAGRAARQQARPRAPSLPQKPSAAETPPTPEPPMPAPAPRMSPLRATQPSTPVDPPPSLDASARDALLAKGKAFRPLAQYLLAEIEKLALAITAEPKPGHFALSRADRTFGALIVSPRDVRLALATPGQPFDAGFAPARFPAEAPPGLTHQIALTDARQVNEALLARIRDAATAP